MLSMNSHAVYPRHTNPNPAQGSISPTTAGIATWQPSTNDVALLPIRFYFLQDRESVFRAGDRFRS